MVEQYGGGHQSGEPEYVVVGEVPPDCPFEVVHAYDRVPRQPTRSAPAAPRQVDPTGACFAKGCLFPGRLHLADGVLDEESRTALARQAFLGNGMRELPVICSNRVVGGTCVVEAGVLGIDAGEIMLFFEQLGEDGALHPAYPCASRVRRPAA